MFQIDLTQFPEWDFFISKIINMGITLMRKIDTLNRYTHK